MKRIRSLMVATLVVAGLLGSGFHPGFAQEATPEALTSESVTGSGERYLTRITQETEGDLHPEDLRQASVLSSRILTHINNAYINLVDENREKAEEELEHAQSLVKVVRDLLPITTVKTSVENPDGKVIYEYVERVQNDDIPIYEGLIAVEVIQPLIEARKEQAALKGVQLAEAQAVYTAVTMDLRYVERKVNLALKKLENPAQALAELLLAQARGVTFITHKEDDPLLEAQAALRLAERQVREEKFAGAKANLQLAQLQLETYRSLAGEDSGEKVRSLEQEIEELREQVHEPGAADSIRGFWNRVTGWFRNDPGTAQVNEAESDADAGSGEHKQ